MSRLDPTTVRHLPKVELHVHLEGTMPASLIAGLAADAGEPLPAPEEELFSASNLSDFLAFLDWSCGLVRSKAVAADVAKAYARRAAEDGIRYAEVIVNPAHWSGLDVADLLTGVAEGFRQAADIRDADCAILVSVLRSQSSSEAEALVDWMIAARPDRVVGLSVDGNEAATGRTGERFQTAYRRAAAAGYGVTAHAGESSGPEGVIDALDRLGVSRVDHGVRSVEDGALVQRLATEKIPLNVCLSSNQQLLYPDLGDHPLRRLVDSGVAVTLNTDDPAFLGCDLTGEMLLAAELLEWDVGDLVDVTRTAIDAAFADGTTRAALHTELERFRTSTPDHGDRT